MARKQRAKSIEQLKEDEKTTFDGDIGHILPSQYESNSRTTFFWTNDKFIDGLDDKEILKRLQIKYPALAPNQDEQEQKKQIILLVNDKQFVEEIFAWYSIDEFDLFKILYQYFGNVFKGPFLKKIKLEMRDKTYATNVKKHIRKAKPRS